MCCNLLLCKGTKVYSIFGCICAGCGVEGPCQLKWHLSNLLHRVCALWCIYCICCRLYFQIKPELPRSQWRATKMTVKIASTADLWRTCYKSPYATIEIPELEFEFSADGKRHTDSIYNHIGSAVYNLGACG